VKNLLVGGGENERMRELLREEEMRALL